MASANVSNFFQQFGLVATLLLQLHGLLYIYIIYRHHVNKRLSIYYDVKQTIAQKFNPQLHENFHPAFKMLKKYIYIYIYTKRASPGNRANSACFVIKL